MSVLQTLLFKIGTQVGFYKASSMFFRRGGHTVGQDLQKCKETSSPLADKQQTGEHVEYKNFS